MDIREFIKEDPENTQPLHVIIDATQPDPSVAREMNEMAAAGYVVQAILDNRIYMVLNKPMLLDVEKLAETVEAVHQQVPKGSTIQ